MKKNPAGSLESIVRASLAEAMARIGAQLADAIARATAAQVREGARASRGPRARPRRVRPPRVEITTWIADARARRVPTFVIEATGLDTKKKIVARFGPAKFERGKPVPPVVTGSEVKKVTPPRRSRVGKPRPQEEKRASSPGAVRTVVARPPVIRKKSAGA